MRDSRFGAKGPLSRVAPSAAMLRGASSLRAPGDAPGSPPRRSARLRPVEAVQHKVLRSRTHVFASSSDSMSFDGHVGSAFDARPPVDSRTHRRPAKPAARVGKPVHPRLVAETIPSSDDDEIASQKASKDFELDGEDEIRAHMDVYRAEVEPEVMPLHPSVVFGPSRNSEIAPAMRCKLVNWLLEVCLHFRLHRATLYLAVHYVDRVLSVWPHTRRSGFQLLGVTALFMAAKLEEIYPPKLAAFSELCDGACPPRAIVSTELQILDALEWRLGVPTTFYWLGLYVGRLRRAMAAALPCPGDDRPRVAPDIDADAVFRAATALLDLALHTPGNTAHAYSILAASALHLQLHDARLVHFLTDYTHAVLREAISFLWTLGACPGQAVCEMREMDPALHGQHSGADASDSQSDLSSAHVFDLAVALNNRVMEYVCEEMRHGRL